jgi:Uma2 family endonuclease
MKVPEFLAWADAQPQPRHELVDGKAVAMAPERQRHNLVKLEVAIALREAVRRAGLSCTVFTDGVGVVIDENNLRIPDATVQCGVDIEADAQTVAKPVIVVEVASPSTVRTDSEVKLVDYFSVSSIQQYLIVHADNRVVIHHRRNDRGTIDTRIVYEGDIVLDPPGMSVSVAALLGPAAAAKES